MSYSKAAYERAYEVLRERRRRSEEDAKRRRNELYRKIPQLAEIDGLLAQTAGAITRQILSGGDPAAAVREQREQNSELLAQRERILKRAGCSAEDLNERYVCPQCEDTGAVGIRRCECMESLLKAESCRILSGGSRLKLTDFKGFSLDFYSDAPDAGGVTPRRRMEWILQFCRQYADRFGEGAESLLFRGNTGLGKTHLSLAIAEQVIRMGYGVVYCSAQTVFGALEREKFSRESGGSETLDGLLGCDLLVFDDLGAEFSTSFTTATVNTIVGARLLEDRPTIISTNLSLEELEAAYSARLLSRIVGGYQMLNFVGKDVRYLKKTGNGH